MNAIFANTVVNIKVPAGSVSTNGCRSSDPGFH